MNAEWSGRKRASGEPTPVTANIGPMDMHVAVAGVDGGLHDSIVFVELDAAYLRLLHESIPPVGETES